MDFLNTVKLPQLTAYFARASTAAARKAPVTGSRTSASSISIASGAIRPAPISATRTQHMTDSIALVDPRDRADARPHGRHRRPVARLGAVHLRLPPRADARSAARRDDADRAEDRFVVAALISVQRDVRAVQFPRRPSAGGHRAVRRRRLYLSRASRRVISSRARAGIRTRPGWSSTPVRMCRATRIRIRARSRCTATTGSRSPRTSGRTAASSKARSAQRAALRSERQTRAAGVRHGLDDDRHARRRRRRARGRRSYARLRRQQRGHVVDAHDRFHRQHAHRARQLRDRRRHDATFQIDVPVQPTITGRPLRPATFACT